MAKGNGKGNGRGNGSRNVSEPTKPDDAGEQRSNSPEDDQDQDQAEAPDTHDAKGRFAKGNPFRFPPGRSGNPKGRPPKPSLVDAICRKLHEAAAMAEQGHDRFDDDGNKLRAPTIDEVAMGLLELCIGGDREAVMMLTQLLDRLDGKVTAKHEHTGADGDAIEIRQARDDILSRIAGQVARSRTASDSESVH